MLQVITATRDFTGGSLGYTPQRYKGGNSLWALQFSDKTTWYLIALVVWAVGLYIWYRVDRSMLRYALEAISEDEDAAAATGVHVTAEKLKITVLSAVMTALAQNRLPSLRTRQPSASKLPSSSAARSARSGRFVARSSSV